MINARTLSLPAILLLLLLCNYPRLDAQDVDTVWQVDYQIRIDSWDGKQQYPLDTITIWFNDHLARQKVSQDRYVVIRNDSIQVADTFHTEVSTMELSWMNKIWEKDLALVWRHRRAPDVRAVRDEEEETIASYPTKRYHFDFQTNRMPPFPMRIYVWGSDELPISRAELKQLYQIRSLMDDALAVDHHEINDTLLSWGILPFRTRIVSNTGQRDTSGVQVMELLSVKRTTMPKEHFLPPPGWEVTSVPSPTEEQIWDLEGIPMPGGPKQEE